MGHWAEIDENNIVKRVIVIKEEVLDTGGWGDKSNWVKTSYNTHNGKHYLPKQNQDWSEESADQSKALRYRFAGVGMYYDATNDVFYEPQPYASWVINKTTWIWEAPIEKPELTDEQSKTGKYYIWNETLYQSDNTKGWELTTQVYYKYL